MKVFLNTRLCDEKAARISVFDHGFLYGDGVYETVRAYGGRVFRGPKHLQRLRRSARAIALSCPWSDVFLLSVISRVLKANRQSNATVRLTLARGEGPLGLDSALCRRPTLVAQLHPGRALEPLRERGVSIGLVSVRHLPSASLDARIKGISDLPMVLAKQESRRMQVFDGLLLNARRHLTETTTANIFFVRKGVVFTPSLACGILDGITRGVAIDLIRREGGALREGFYVPRDLRQAEECFLTNTTLEIMPVVRICWEGRSTRTVGGGTPGLVTRRLQRLYRATVQNELAKEGSSPKTGRAAAAWLC